MAAGARSSTVPRKALATFLATFFCFFSMASSRAQSVKRHITWQGLERSYRIHVPTALDRSHLAAVVLAFHGGGGTAAGMERITGLDEAADEFGFIAVYPEGLNQHWNDGRSNLPGRTADDVGFTGALLDQLKTDYQIDPQRIFACGISNGGFFCQHLSCALPDKIAAIASVAASVPEGAVCSAARAVPIICFLGDEDPLVPYAGGDIRGPFGGVRGRVMSAADSVAFWLRHNHCNEEPSLTLQEQVAPGLGFECKGYSSAQIDNCVVLYTIHGGGHTWPGGGQYLSVRVVGRAVQFLNANKIMWTFFSRHPMGLQIPGS